PLTKPLPMLRLEMIVPEGMVYIPGGDLMIGSGIANKDNPSGPPHRVTIKPFFVDKYEVTREGYKNFVRATGHTAPPDWKDQSYPVNSGQWPVTGVWWRDADAYCKWKGGRLPTEEEWEFAARGADGRLYPWGNTFDVEKANVARQAGSLSPVGSFPTGASPYGVFDLSGNAWEWTESDFKPYPGSSYELVGCKRCKVLRGGAYVNRPEYATATYRQPYEAAVIALPNNYYGFRCARSMTLP